MSVGQREPALLALSLATSSYRRYPGETVSLFARLEVGAGVPGFTFRVTVPPGLSLEDYGVLSGLTTEQPLITRGDGANHLTWRVEPEPGSSGQYEVWIAAQVDPTQEDGLLEARAVATADLPGDKHLRDEATLAITVLAQARWLKYLPALYREDDLMARFLMLFESFWTPIDQQIDSLSYYFDPRFTPPDLLPWLASWINLVLDERWPEHKRRRLLRAAVPLYRKRGTRQGLAEYLEIYTGQRPRIVEHRAHNLCLGPEARLGPGIALGTVNKPHTFTVVLRLPPIPSEDKKERTQQELERRRKIEAIIDAEKPAHTAYTLRLEIDPELKVHETR